MVRFMIGTKEYVLLATMNEEKTSFYILNGKWSGYLHEDGSGVWVCQPPSGPVKDITHIYDKMTEVTKEEWFEYATETGTDIYIDKDELDRLKRIFENEYIDDFDDVDYSVFNDDCPF